jgi:hypothetical protein
VEPTPGAPVSKTPPTKPPARAQARKKVE